MIGHKYQITIPEPTAEKLEQLSKDKGMSKSTLIALAIEEYVKQDNEKKEEKK